jgi:hypothetical protein
MRHFLAVIRFSLERRPALLAAVLLPVLVTMLVAVAAPAVPTIAAAAVALPAAMVAWGGGVLAGKLHEQGSTPLTTVRDEGPAVVDDLSERRKRAA